MGKKKLAGIVILLIVVLGGAYFAYGKLGNAVSGNQLVSAAGNKQTETKATEDKKKTESEETVRSSESAESIESTGMSENAEEQKSEQEGKVAVIDFEVIDGDRNPVHLTDLTGEKPVVLNFWASWCSPCVAELPGFENKYNELGDKINFVMVNLTDNTRDTVEGASQFIKDLNYSFPVYYDTKFEAVQAYNVYTFPQTFFIDKDGYIVANAMGMMSEETLQKGIDMIYSEDQR